MATATGTNTASYGDCVAALRTSLSFLESSVNTLGNGVSDFPRLMNVLKTTRVRILLLPLLPSHIPHAILPPPPPPSPPTYHQKPVKLKRWTQHYELIPQTTLQTAEASLRSELAPAITTLLDRADAHIDRVERRIESLKARAELQQGRLEDSTATITASSSRHGNHSHGAKAAKKLDDSARLRARVLRQRREALQYSVERLELEVLQKERELRKRLDVT
ncbi:Spc19-domain-containing protein [Xylariaceae sp. FL1651]|nr:Spc19-domain-containing protein [Xylariaceae sp. FL1651]